MAAVAAMLPRQPEWATEPPDTVPAKPTWDEATLLEVLRSGSDGNNRVALTIDDGYGFRWDLLGILAAQRVRATFFFVGQVLQADAEFIRQATALGLEFGNHTWGHRNLARVSQGVLESEVFWGNQPLVAADNTSIPYFRPPYGAFNDYVRAYVASLGYRTVLWSLDPRDWRGGLSPAWLAQYVVENARPGSIILLHTLRAATVAALGPMIDGLRGKGLEPGSLSEMFAG